jgi:hypothetical protein
MIIARFSSNKVWRNFAGYSLVINITTESNLVKCQEENKKDFLEKG